MDGWVSAASGLVGVTLGAGLTHWREFLTRRTKERKDAAYLAVLVAGLLERFSAGCLRVVHDEGLSEGHGNEHGYRIAQVSTPTFDPEALKVEWKSLPSDWMYAILDLPYRVEVANNVIDQSSEYAAMPPDFEEFFEQRQYQYATLGVDAVRLAARLRKHAGLPEREAEEWDPVASMETEKSRIQTYWIEKAQRPLPEL